MGLGKFAEQVAGALDEDMGRCILPLYRSAAQPMMKIWGQDLEKAARRPGLWLIAEADNFTGGEARARRSAARAGAKIMLLTGVGHWWMCQDPAQGARALNEFFSTVERSAPA
jgi:pimeloyl-ACP methyl ester carboxylesterase